jgi:RNA polymerase sigma-70 factor (ECF subfamily)
VVDQYVRAFTAADVPGLVRLLARDAVLEMPPVALWYRGRRDYGRFMDRVFALRGPGWQVRVLTANGQPALAAYAPGPSGDGLRFHSLQVLTVGGGSVSGDSVSGDSVSAARVTANVVFADPRGFAPFGLPQQLAAEKFPAPR